MIDEPGLFPYRLRPDFLSEAETAFYHVLAELMKKKYLVFPKVALADLFFVTRPNENVQHISKLLRRNVDFVLFQADTLKPALAIELDHPKQVDHRPVDGFVEELFASAGLPLLHVTEQRVYALDELALQFSAGLDKAKGAGALQKTDFSPICPRCGITMVLRFDKDGPYTGQKYYGCLNFPQCQETISLAD